MRAAPATAAVTAIERGMLTCETCGLLSRTGLEPAQAEAALLRCPRCHARLHARKPASLLRTWLFLRAASILDVPAPLLPSLETRALFDSADSTIMTGVILFGTGG
ncbi:MAG: paraquat-inducible protein A, partial [Burkholderiaceae bacterium]